jgi:hypothetical protein
MGILQASGCRHGSPHMVQGSGMWTRLLIALPIALHAAFRCMCAPPVERWVPQVPWHQRLVPWVCPPRRCAASDGNVRCAAFQKCNDCCLTPFLGAGARLQYQLQPSMNMGQRAAIWMQRINGALQRGAGLLPVAAGWLSTWKGSTQSTPIRDELASQLTAQHRAPSASHTCSKWLQLTRP